MKKIIFILYISSIFFYGCGPGLLIDYWARDHFDKNIIKNFDNINSKEHVPAISIGGGKKFFIFGFIPFPPYFSNTRILLSISNFKKLQDFKINSYIIKVNDKIKRKKIKAKPIKEEYDKNYASFYFREFTSYKDGDSIEIIFDISILKNGIWDNVIVSEKFIGWKRKEFTFLWD